MNVNDSNNQRLTSSSNNNNTRKRDSNAIAPTVASSSDVVVKHPSKAPRRIADEKPPPDDSNEPKWRGDPTETYSDWKIEITSGETTQVYHVHKFILACGRRKSDYFARLFQVTSQFREGESNTSRIELDPLAAAAFPQLLDYVYQYEKPLDITVETAVALHHLGEYFEMQHLRWDAKQFVAKEMTVDNVDTFYTHAVQFQNGSILDAVSEFLGENILSVNPKECAILKQPDPELWLHVLAHVDQQDSDANQRASKVVAQFTSNHRHSLNAEAFDQLTAQGNLPTIHPNAALNLCRFYDRFHSSDDNKRTELSSLHERCATSLSQIQLGQWMGFFSNRNKLWKLKERRPAFLVDLLSKVVHKFNSDYEELEQETKSLRGILKRFQPVNHSGRMVEEYDARNQFIFVPEELQKERPELGNTAHFGFQKSLSTLTLPAFYYDNTMTIEDDEEGSESEEGGQEAW